MRKLKVKEVEADLKEAEQVVRVQPRGIMACERLQRVGTVPVIPSRCLCVCMQSTSLGPSGPWLVVFVRVMSS